MTHLLHAGKTLLCYMHPPSKCCHAIDLPLKSLSLATDVTQTAHTNGSQACLQMRTTWGDFNLTPMSMFFLEGRLWVWGLF